MDVNIIVAAGKNGAIGRRGDLIWCISSDLKRFKALTMGHTVIMGRKTWDSLPKRPLPGRRNIVVSRNPKFTAPGAEVANSPERALQLAQGEKVFIMGGAQLYDALFSLANRVYLTEIDAECSDADAFIEFPLDPYVWRTAETSTHQQTSDNVTYRYVIYERK